MRIEHYDKNQTSKMYLSKKTTIDNAAKLYGVNDLEFSNCIKSVAYDSKFREKGGIYYKENVLESGNFRLHSQYYMNNQGEDIKDVFTFTRRGKKPIIRVHDYRVNPNVISADGRYTLKGARNNRPANVIKTLKDVVKKLAKSVK